MTSVGDGSVYWLGGDGPIDRFHAGRGCDFNVFASRGSEPNVTEPTSYGSGVYEVIAADGAVYAAGCAGIPGSWSTGYRVRQSGSIAEARVEVRPATDCPAWSATVVNEKSAVVYVRTGTDVRALLQGDSTVYDDLEGDTATFGFSETRALAVVVDSPCTPAATEEPETIDAGDALYLAGAWALVLAAYSSAVVLGAMEDTNYHAASVAVLLVAQRATREMGGLHFIAASLAAVCVSFLFMVSRSSADRVFGRVTDHSSDNYVSAALVLILFVSGCSVIAAAEGH